MGAITVQGRRNLKAFAPMGRSYKGIHRSP